MARNIGIDIGGTKILIGIVEEDTAQVVASRKLPMRVDLSPEETIALIAREVISLVRDSRMRMQEIGHIGAGVPGTVAARSGVAQYCPNISWFDVPVGRYFEERLQRKVLLGQDSRLAALAEALYGAGRGFHDIACITIGTGIGCGIVSGGRIFCGGMDTAGELGHIAVVRGGRECPCGKRGCLERYSSGTGMLISAKEMFPQRFGELERTEDLFRLAYQDDADALEVIWNCVEKLAFGIATMVDLLSPQAVIISGGLCEHKDLVVAPLRRLVYENGYAGWTRKRTLTIRAAQLGSEAPMIGASALFQEE